MSVLKTPPNSLVTKVPCYYISTSRDNALAPTMQEIYGPYIVSGNKENILAMDSDHMPWISHPKELEQHLRKAISGILESHQ